MINTGPRAGEKQFSEGAALSRTPAGGASAPIAQKGGSDFIRKLGSGFIVSRTYDSLFFILSPVLAFLLVEFVANWDWALDRQNILGAEQAPMLVFITVWTHAHLFAVVFRSHANPKVFRLHRFAFIGVPVLLFVGFMVSDWLIITGMLVSALWAVYHLGMQNFGLGRIYDVRWGNPPEMGRSLDYWFQQCVNLGPFLFGFCLMPTLYAVRRYREVGWEEPTEWLKSFSTVQSNFSTVIVPAGLLFIAFYVYSYRRLTRQGYRPCPQKIVLMVATGSASVISWGFLPAWKAFFVMNFFHALQYFALVWWTEKSNIRRMARLDKITGGMWLALCGFAATALIVGVSSHVYGNDYITLRWTASLVLVMALMHYWYDGFIWSVRKREV
jgi:hypothetical protein